MKNPTPLFCLAESTIALSLALLTALTALVTPAVALTATPTPSPTPTSKPTPTATPFIPYDALEVIMSVEGVSMTEGNSGTKSLNIQLKTRSYFRVNSKPIGKDDYKVKFWTQARTASPRIDYTPLSASFKVGSVGNDYTKTISIPIKGDTSDEGDEVFEGNFTAGPRSSFETGTGGYAKSMVIKCTIIDDDSPAPVASGGTLTAVSGVTSEATLSAKGKAGTTFGYRIVKSPAFGEARIIQNGETSVLSYTSRKDYVGDDPLTLQAFDNVKTGPTATWKIHVVANQSPTLLNISPNTGTFTPNSEVTFQLNAKDGNGTTDLSALFLTLSNSATEPDATKGLALEFNPDANLFRLRSNDGGSWSKWVSLGSSLENAQAKVLIGTGDVSRSSDGTLTVRPHITFKSGWTGRKTLWGRVEDKGGSSDGFDVLGSILLDSTPNPKSSSASAPES